MNYSEYNSPENWIGGYYELSIEFHPCGDDQRINKALRSLDKSPFFTGLWRERTDYQQSPASLPIIIEENSVSPFYGALHISDGKLLPCCISVIRVPEESDWLDISIPLASLELFYPFNYPLTKELNPWLSQVDELLINLAETIFAQSPFDLAFVGEEITGATDQESITSDFVEKCITILPKQLQEKLQLQSNSKLLSNELKLFY
ncbi:hypothetical protein [Ornithinibacillus scapharcae]|uniref:hypothetical protein n=1 Tax=Ornithinibacillus scapharcae TaxID=1147159 RepID=UPI000225B097|nr:hypothetical protein [Ornithinibacillus scapharcae]